MDARMERFEDYVTMIAGHLGHADRVAPFRGYCAGLMLPGKRKSVEPMAARVAPGEVRSAHQRLHHFVADAPWSDAAVLGAVRDHVLTVAAKRAGTPEVLIIDDTGFPKQGKHSVGVARQYCGQLGKQDNCQVAVSLSLANQRYSVPVGYRMYLPRDWSADRARREKAKVPQDIEFATKPEIAMGLVDEAIAAGVAPAIVVADAGYGVDTTFRDQLSARQMQYAVGITSAVKVWPEGSAPLPPAPWSGQGRKPVRLRRDAQHQPLSVKTLAFALTPRQYQSVTWREGTNRALSSRFAAVRVRCAQPACGGGLRAQEWLLIEWLKGDAEPLKYFLSTLPASTPIKELVRVAKLRWRIERDYQELKQEFGLDHFEGRSWRGFHHHASLSIAAYGFLLAERLALPKKTLHDPLLGPIPALPTDFRPRGSPAAPAPRARFDRNPAPRTRRSADRSTLALPLLRETG
ncbi:MAG TPA: IS701 family transposase [Casimicrobiaceae bacterium]|nr:IS701 family transposase [Casimicrobiaceae bacterium]